MSLIILSFVIFILGIFIFGNSESPAERRSRLHSELMSALLEDDLKAARKALICGADPNYERYYVDRHSDTCYYHYPLSYARSEAMKALLRKYGATKSFYAKEP